MMAVRYTLGLFICLFLSQTSAEVVELTNDTFEPLTQASTGQTTGKWMVKFYATWCGHCKKLEPVWTALDTALMENHSDKGINVAKIDAIKNRDTAIRFQVKAYPTLLYFAGRRMYEYQGGRDIESLVDFVTEEYKKLNGKIVPPPPGLMEVYRKKMLKAIHANRNLSMLYDDVEHILQLRKNAALVILFLGIFFGGMLGFIVGTLTSGDSRQKKAKKD
jgi:protein disulfide-isomerase-like protein